MSLVIDALDMPAARHSRVHCLSDGTAPVALDELGRRARQAAAALQTMAGRGGTVAALLGASHDCLAAVFGALRSGLTLVSLPHPARGMEPGDYLAQLNQMCALSNTTHLLCEPSLVELLSGVEAPVRAFGDTSSPAPPADEAPGRFVQFTSGSTGTPRGISLSLDAIEANLTSMYDWLEPRGDAVICSWLPLSHDMGLFGLALYALCMGNPPWSVPSQLVLMAPEWFMADPARWMRACTDYRATSTTSPPFALRFATRSLRGPGSFDLSTLRSLVVGSEPVPADGLREFEAVALGYGLSPNVVCPGYGMAEATLAVAIDDNTSPWHSVRVDSEALGRQQWVEVDEGGTELVSCGAPVARTEIRTVGDDAVGELELRGPSLLSGYVGDTSSPLMDDGWLHTSDLAYLRGREAFVVGRTDDVVIVAGRNLDARALDAAVGAHPGCRTGTAACVSDGSGRYVVVAEPSDAAADPANLRTSAREIRAELARQFGAAPSSVVFIERGTLPKTPSGKVRRNHLRGLWAAGRLQQLGDG